MDLYIRVRYDKLKDFVTVAWVLNTENRTMGFLVKFENNATQFHIVLQNSKINAIFRSGLPYFSMIPMLENIWQP